MDGRSLVDLMDERGEIGLDARGARGARSFGRSPHPDAEGAGLTLRAAMSFERGSAWIKVGREKVSLPRRKHVDAIAIRVQAMPWPGVQGCSD